MEKVTAFSFERSLKHLNVNTNSNLSFSLIKIEQLIKICKSLGGSFLSISDYFPYDFPFFIKSCLENGIKPLVSLKKVVFVNNSRVLVSFFPTNFSALKVLNQFIESNIVVFPTLDSLLGINPGCILVVEVDDQRNFSSFLAMREQVILHDNKERVYLGVKFADWNHSENNDFTVPFFAIKVIEESGLKDLSNFVKTPFSSHFSYDDIEQAPFPYNSVDFLSSFNESQLSNLVAIFANVERISSLISIELPTEDEENHSDYLVLKNKCSENFSKLNFLASESQKYLEVLNSELEIIKELNFSSYFLRVEEIINRVIPDDVEIGPGRGSSSSSLVAFLLGITKIDPLKNGLFFWRFLNEKRKEQPDIDVDVSDFKRVFTSICQRYGNHNVSRIVTKKKIGWSHSFDCSLNLLANSFFQHFISQNKKHLINENLVNGKEKFIRENFFEIKRFAEVISELNISSSIHASGLVISSNDLRYEIPLKKEGEFHVTLYTSNSLKALGIKKYDFLSLNSSLGLIKSLRDKRINIPSYHTISLADNNTFKLINSRFLSGLFQIDTISFREILKNFEIKNFSDLVILISINRPGASRNIKQIIVDRNQGFNSDQSNKFSSSLVNNILSDTYGKIVFEEQVTLIIHHCLDIKLSEAELIRKQIKKDKERLESFKSFFLESSRAKISNHHERVVILNMISESIPYLYNKSHATSYAYLTYFGAYLKANFSSHFFSFFTNGLNKLENWRLLEELLFIGYKLVFPKFTTSTLNSWSFDQENMIAKIPLSYVNNHKYLALLSGFVSRGKRVFSNLGEFISENIENITDSEEFYNDLIDWAKIGIFDCVRNLTFGLISRELSSIRDFVSLKKRIPEYESEHLSFNENYFTWQDPSLLITEIEKERIEKKLFGVYLSSNFFLCIIEEISRTNSSDGFMIKLSNLFLDMNIPIDDQQFQLKKNFLKVGTHVFVKKSYLFDKDHWLIFSSNNHPSD